MKFTHLTFISFVISIVVIIMGSHEGWNLFQKMVITLLNIILAILI
jgi:hypothetical protein